MSLLLLVVRRTAVVRIVIVAIQSRLITHRCGQLLIPVIVYFIQFLSSLSHMRCVVRRHARTARGAAIRGCDCSGRGTFELGPGLFFLFSFWPIRNGFQFKFVSSNRSTFAVNSNCLIMQFELSGSISNRTGVKFPMDVQNRLYV